MNHNVVVGSTESVLYDIDTLNSFLYWYQSDAFNIHHDTDFLVAGDVEGFSDFFLQHFCMYLAKMQLKLNGVEESDRFYKEYLNSLYFEQYDNIFLNFDRFLDLARITIRAICRDYQLFCFSEGEYVNLPTLSCW